MPKYVIERGIPGAGKLTPEDMKAISQKSSDECSPFDVAAALRRYLTRSTPR